VTSNTIFGVHLESLRQLPRRVDIPRARLSKRLAPSALDRLAGANLRAVETGPTTTVDPGRCREAGIDAYASVPLGATLPEGRARRKLERLRDEGYRGATVTAGSALDTLGRRCEWTETILRLQSELDFPLALETHRASMTQDIGRTCDLARRYPELSFNLDLSHWFYSHGLWAHSVDSILDAIAPVVAGTRHVHLRVSSELEIQADLDDATHLGTFLEVWHQVLARHPEHPIVVIAELLPPMYGYARTTSATNRWDESLWLIELLRGALDGRP
jgi:hypothetical protein